MVEGGSDTTFPIVFFDGEREINMGGVRIYPSLEFKNFQSGLSQRIGISPNQITVYLVYSKKTKSSTEIRRKIPVTGKVNFAAIAKETDCFFLVVLKRSRRNRRSKPRQSGVEFGDYLPGSELSQSPEKLILLRRSQTDLDNQRVSGYVSPHYNQITQLEFAGYERFQNLQIQRENYVTMMNSNSNSTLNFDLDTFPIMEEGFSASPAVSNNRSFCDECTNARGKRIPPPFHQCVFDSIVVGFRSPAGPISRPRKA